MSIWRIVLFGLGVTVGLVLAMGYTNEELANFFSESWPLILGIVLALIMFTALVLYLAFYFVRKAIRKRLDIEVDLAIDEAIPALADKYLYSGLEIQNATSLDKQRAAVINVGLWFARQKAMQFQFALVVTLFGGIVGAATLYLLHEQNKKIQEQNNKLTLQTDATVIQSLLLEGNRRAAFGDRTQAMIDSVLSETSSSLATELENKCGGENSFSCWQFDDAGERTTYRLSKSLQAVIQSLVRTSTPFHMVESAVAEPDFDKVLSEQIELKYQNPEITSLFRILVNESVDLSQFDFSRIALNYGFLVNAKLSGAKMSFANLEGANLHSSNLSRAILDGANLKNAELIEADLSRARLSGTNLANALFVLAKLTEADLTFSNLSGADFELANVTEVRFDGAWAWSDNLPKSLTGNVEIQVCAFDPAIHNRDEAPDLLECEFQEIVHAR